MKEHDDDDDVQITRVGSSHTARRRHTEQTLLKQIPSSTTLNRSGMKVFIELEVTAEQSDEVESTYIPTHMDSINLRKADDLLVQTYLGHGCYQSATYEVITRHLS